MILIYWSGREIETVGVTVRDSIVSRKEISNLVCIVIQDVYGNEDS